MANQILYEAVNPAMLAEFNTILKYGRVTTLYQPIVDLKNGDILGYEALSRGPGSSILHSPLALLSVAELLNKTWELERLLRIKALENATFTDQHLLFLNVDPNIVNDAKFKKGFTKDNLKKLNISPNAIVLELTERSAINNYEDFKAVLKHYTDQGYSIAIDDVGSGYSGLRTMYEIYPKFLKIDMDLIRDIDQDSFKQAIVKSLIETTRIAHIKIIAEGIETADELRTLMRLGVDYGQGYFIQKPERAGKAIREEILDIIQKENNLIHQIENYSEDYHYVHHVMTQVNAYEKEATCKAVHEYLIASGNTSVCVTHGGFPVGLVTLNEINSVFARQFGYSVYSHRPIDLIVHKNPLMVDFYTPIQDVAKKALQRPAEHLYDDIIVCKGAKYVGIVTMKQILDYAINYEKKYAKELNPLTSLPGNVIINRVIQGVLEADKRATLLYVDLDNFKAYNDVYGFDNGDKIIKMTAEVLNEVITVHAPYTTFVGHIGGDDFIIINSSEAVQAQEICLDIVKRFDERIVSFFNSQDIAKGHISAQDRHGEFRDFPLTAISIAGVTGVMSGYDNVDRISAYLTNLKKEAKKVQQSSYVLNTVIA